MKQLIIICLIIMNAYEFNQYTHLYTSTMRSEKPVVVHEGGTSSSKTYSLMQGAFTKALAHPGCTFTIIGQDIPNLKKGVIRDAKNIMINEPWLKPLFHDYKSGDRIYESKAGSIIEFTSYDDPQDAKSGKREFSFFNEANGIHYGVFEEINLRTSIQTWIDFNPNARFWAHENILPDTENRDWFVSNFRHNPYIDQTVLNKILSYEPTPENIERGTANLYRWQVYGLGQVGRLEGLVFADFRIAHEWPERYKWRVFGLDFGFTNDPTALVEIRYTHGRLYWREWFYYTGMTNTDISNRLSDLEFPKDECIIADSAEPKSIQELCDAGWWVEGAQKGPDSVIHGIQTLQQYPIFIYAKSLNLIEEFGSYIWKVDKDKKPLNVPIDKYNHGIDGGRYAVTNRVGTSNLMGIY